VAADMASDVEITDDMVVDVAADVATADDVVSNMIADIACDVDFFMMWQLTRGS